MLAKVSERVRSPDWDDAETMLLAKLKREVFLRGEEGGHVWHEISLSISGRSAKQCQRRWETLVKVYSHVQEYCTQTGQDHEELDDEELASMRLETAYRHDWYIIVRWLQTSKEVCSARKRRRICDGGAAAMVSKGSSTPVMETLLTTRPATTDGPVITSPDSDCENKTKLQSRESPDSENQVAQVPISTDPLEDARVTDDVTVKTPPEIECAESKPAPSGLLDEYPYDAQCNGAETEGGTSDSKTGKYTSEEKPPSPIPENIDLSWFMSEMSLSTAETTSQNSPPIVSEGTITRQSSDNSILKALDTNSDLQAASEVIISPDSDFESITKFQSRQTLDFENHVEKVSTSTLVSCAPNSPRQDSMASSLMGWADATDKLNLQVEQTWTNLQFLVPEGSWPEYPRHDRGLLEAGNFFTFNCFSPPISFPLRFFPEDRIQEHQSQEHVKKRCRSPNWCNMETKLLAELRREAFLRGEVGNKVWIDFSRTISGRSVLQCRSARECRVRWEIIVKVYNFIQDYCVHTKQDHEELDDEELASMKLMTAYRRDWYIIVHGLYGHRKGKEIRNCDRVAAATVSKESSIPVRETLPMTRPATTASPVNTHNTKFQLREILDFENHVEQEEIYP